MAVQKINIEQFLQLSAEYPLLDVRSPGEYTHAHIPGALSLPLFTDEERKVVGTAYKQQSREIAIKIGLDYFGIKMRGMVEQVENMLTQKKNKKLLLFFQLPLFGESRNPRQTNNTDIHMYMNIHLNICT